MSSRYLFNQIKQELGKNKAIIIYGARQVGKTTLAKNILSLYNPSEILSYTGDSENDINLLQGRSVQELQNLLRNRKVLFIDEAQAINNIGRTIKLIVDHFPEVQVIATGSSSFELRSQIAEPMTGRSSIFKMYPLAVSEISNERKLEDYQLGEIVNELAVFGSYPEITNLPTSEKENKLLDLKDNYLYKDLLTYNRIHKSTLIDDLLVSLATQLGSEVNFSQLGNILGIDKKTVMSYIEILEQSFIIFRLKPLARSHLREINTPRKIYFYDNGIRNSLVNNFSDFKTRTDKGALFENLMISERQKSNDKNLYKPNKYFWRSYDDAEVDYIEEKNGVISAFEFKANSKNPEINQKFTEAYKSVNKVINLDNWREFIL